MRRMMITIGATVTGTAAVLIYQPSIERAARTLESTTDGEAGDGQTGAVRDVGVSAMVGRSASVAPADAPTDPAFTWTDGPGIRTAAGQVQVRVGLENGAIRDVQLLQGPHGTRHSAWLTRRASLILRAEVLNAQSADVDMISGATYTSDGYLRSLQAALDAAEGR